MATKYRLDFSRLVEQLLPLGMRSRSVLALLRAGLWPIIAPKKGILSKFESIREECLFDLRHNGQVCYLRAALNAKFKSSLGVLFDIKETTSDIEWVYAKEENSRTGHIYASDERTKEQTDLLVPDETILDGTRSFIVLVPQDLYNTQLPQIKQFVNKYRLVSRVPQYGQKNS